MGKPPVAEAKISALDIRMMLSILLCCLTATVLNHFGLRFPYGTMQLEIIQKMTACISCIFCCQETVHISRKACVNRLTVTAVGGGLGILAVLMDTALGNQWLMVLLVGAGVLFSLYLCKLARVPVMTARIGGVTFILVACTLNGTARIPYALFRLLSTLYASLVVLSVTWLSERFRPSGIS